MRQILIYGEVGSNGLLDYEVTRGYLLNSRQTCRVASEPAEFGAKFHAATALVRPPLAVDRFPFDNTSVEEAIAHYVRREEEVRCVIDKFFELHKKIIIISNFSEG